MASSMALPQRVHDHLSRTLGSEMPALQKWKSIKDILVDSGIAYVATIKASAFVVHPKNRSGALISPHGCHRKGLQIAKSGADMSLLGNSVCMELNPNMNERKVDSTTLLAPISGTERYASLSSGHTVQFIKAVIHGCDTSEADLSGPNGKLGPHVWQGDADLAAMVQSGWPWLVIPSSMP